MLLTQVYTKSKFILLFSISYVFLSGCNSGEKDYTQYVNTFIGTEGTGHTFPGPCLPFGLVQPGPDNTDQGWDYTTGYQYRDTTIMGFSQTRANGTGISEFGDILLMPYLGENKASFSQGYYKETEEASPGYYSVMLKDGIIVSLTATERVAFHQYVYPVSDANLLLDFQHGLRFLTDSLVLESVVKMDDNKGFSGYCHTKNWVDRKYYFQVLFDIPFYSSVELVKQSQKEVAPRYALKFDLRDKLLKIKIALSTVSVEGAKNNMETELPDWDFKKTVAQAKSKWNHYLSRVDIKAEEEQKRIFYSCLYRLLVQPSNIADVDGKYRGSDDQIHTAKNKEYYSMLSLWDTYRAAHPLYTLLVPEKVNGMMQTLIDHGKAAGFLPIWTAWGQDNYCMIGNHAIPVLTDAILKGFNGFNTIEALELMVKSTSINHINSNWTLLNSFGYYPFDSLSNESVSRTLEHGVDDAAIALLANKMGRNELATIYAERANYYQNLFDDSTQLFRGKDSKGNWRFPFDPFAFTSPMNNPGDYTEANAWQYFFTPAQYDVLGLSKLLGGKQSLTRKLDDFFQLPAQNPNKLLGQEAMIGQYAHGNEPNHHIAYLYAYSETPEKAQRIIKQVCQQFYKDAPNGLKGNDDCGQLSAWYIFACMGFYPVNPMNASFVWAKPQVESLVLHLPNEKNLEIISTDNSPLVRAYFNQQMQIEPVLYYNQLMEGGLLEFKP